MYKSFLITALRNIYSNIRISLINISGLSLSMSLGMLIIVLIADQYSYDDFIERRKEIYRVQTINNLSRYSIPRFASTTFPLASELRSGYSFIEDATALNSSFNGEIDYQGNLLRISGLYAEENFFDFFNFKMIRGNQSEALTEPFSIVLKEDIARKFFGEDDPLGKTLEVKNIGIFTVNGIVESDNIKSHIQFESLVSASTIIALAQQNESSTNITDDWNRYTSSYVYIIPVKGTETKLVDEALQEISNNHYGSNEDIDLSFYLYPFDKIVPGPVIGNELGVSMPRVYLIFFGGLALIVMLLAAFNYTSLSIARSLTRAKEFGVRKSIGSTRMELMAQIYIEAILISLFSMAIGAGLLQLILPVFKSFNMMALMQVNPSQDIRIYAWFVCFALLTGILAGSLPAAYISRINPLTVLKGQSNIKILKRLSFRKILITTQYFFSLVFIISIILIYRQMKFMVNADMGYNREAIYNIRSNDINPDLIYNIMSRLPEVKSIAFASHTPGVGQLRESDVKINKDAEEAIMTNHFDVAGNYIGTMGLNLLAGSDFPKELNNENETMVIISRLAAEKYGLGSVYEAVGKNIIVDDSLNLRVQGVIENYKYCALFLPERPLILRQRPANARYAVLNLQTGNLPATVSKLEEAWKEIDSSHDMNGQLLDTEIRNYYSYFEDILYMVGYTTLLAVMIAALGLYGMASYSMRTITREVGIRKVFGAGSNNIITKVSGSFVTLLVIAIILGAPVAFFLNNAWLSYIAFHVKFGAGTLIAGILIVILTGILSILSQTMKVSGTNPARTLKYE